VKLVSKVCSPNAFTTSSISFGISGLNHEILDLLLKSEAAGEPRNLQLDEKPDDRSIHSLHELRSFQQTWDILGEIV
jgi:hypothetical protein